MPQYCLLRGRLSRARAQQESSPAEARAAWFSAGYELLALAVNGQPSPDFVPPAPAGGGKVGAGGPRACCQYGSRSKCVLPLWLTGPLCLLTYWQFSTPRCTGRRQARQRRRRHQWRHDFGS